jgi:REP element-mobilizing transposase RayT
LPTQWYADQIHAQHGRPLARDPARVQLEAYIRNQVANEALVDDRFRDMLTSLTVAYPDVDLSVPIETRSSRYWYNLHLVLVIRSRDRIGDAACLARIRDTTLRICVRKGYAASVLSVLPDHLHLAFRGVVTHAPGEIALSFLNNLAHALGRRRWWEAGYYAGTFGEYGMTAVQSGGAEV